MIERVFSSEGGGVGGLPMCKISSRFLGLLQYKDVLPAYAVSVSAQSMCQAHLRTFGFCS